MRLLARSGVWLLRRLFREIRLLRRAVEAQTATLTQIGADYRRVNGLDWSEADNTVAGGPVADTRTLARFPPEASVSYVDSVKQLQMEHIAGNLEALLGRAATEEELAAAFRVELGE